MNNESVQAESFQSFALLDICCKKIAEQISDKEVADWVNGDYLNLSVALARKTKVNLSSNTLKRIFGKLKTTHRYFPQKATRDALAQFIDYRDWHEFELVHKEVKQAAPATPPIAKPVAKTATPKHNIIKYLWVLPVLALIPIIYFSYKKSSKNYSSVSFKCINPNGQTPHSAVFKLKRGINIDEPYKNFKVYFNDNWGRSANFQSNIITHYYDLPGIYYAVLMAKNTIIDTAVVSLGTNNWEATVESERDTTRVFPLNLSYENIAGFSISPKMVDKAGADTLHTFYLHLNNIKKTKISGDNLLLNAVLETSEKRPGIRCSQVSINLFGEHDSHYFTLTKPACVTWTNYKFSETKAVGTKDDLRAFGKDLTQGGDLELQIKDKHVSLFIDKEKVFTTIYKQSVGNILGVSISFGGIGKVDHFSLVDLKTGQKF